MSILKLDVPNAVVSKSSRETETLFKKVNAEMLFGMIETSEMPSDITAKDIVKFRLLRYKGNGKAEFKLLIKDTSGEPGFNVMKVVVNIASDWGDSDYYETKKEAEAAFSTLR